MSSSFDQTSGNESGMKRSLDERDGACATKISDGALDKIFVMRVVEETRKRATPPGPAWNAIHPFSFHRHMGTLYKAYLNGIDRKGDKYVAMHPALFRVRNESLLVD